MTNNSIAKIFALTVGILAVPALSMAGTEVSSSKEVKQVVEQAKESWITGDIGVDIFSQYIFHGLTLENQGAIIQPYADWYIKLYDGEGFLNSATLNLTVWNSFHSNHPVASSTRSWYEFDFYAGISFTFAKHFTLTPTYLAYTSPGDYFETSHNAGLRLAIDDKDWLGAFSIQPYVYVEWELDGKSGNGTGQGTYYEVGIAPSTAVGPINVAFPVKAGFGSSDYYAFDETFGFISAGVSASYSLAFVPEKWGAWSVSAAATYFHFGSANDDANAIKGAGDDDVVFNGGLKVAF